MSSPKFEETRSTTQSFYATPLNNPKGPPPDEAEPDAESMIRVCKTWHNLQFRPSAADYACLTPCGICYFPIPVDEGAYRHKLCRKVFHEKCFDDWMIDSSPLCCPHDGVQLPLRNLYTSEINTPDILDEAYAPPLPSEADTNVVHPRSDKEADIMQAQDCNNAYSNGSADNRGFTGYPGGANVDIELVVMILERLKHREDKVEKEEAERLEAEQERIRVEDEAYYEMIYHQAPRFPGGAIVDIDSVIERLEGLKV